MHISRKENVGETMKPSFKDGHVPWNKGKTGLQHHTEETRRKISNAMLERKLSDGAKKKIGDFHRGKPLSEEHRRKLSIAHLGQIPWCKGRNGLFRHTDEWKKEASERNSGENHPLYGKHHSDITRVKMRDSSRINWSNPEFSKNKREEMRLIHVGKPLLQEHRQHIGEGNKGKIRSEETKEKLSNIKKNGFADGTLQPWNRGKHGVQRYTDETKKKILNSLKPSGPELYLDFLLQNNFPDEWKYVGDGNTIINGLCPDFINVNGKKQIIEMFGEHWHTGGKIRYNQTEVGRKKAFGEHGYDTLIIWDFELKDECAIIEKIRGFSNEETHM
jgi:hypothetical protein